MVAAEGLETLMDLGPGGPSWEGSACVYRFRHCPRRARLRNETPSPGSGEGVWIATRKDGRAAGSYRNRTPLHRARAWNGPSTKEAWLPSMPFVFMSLYRPLMSTSSIAGATGIARPAPYGKLREVVPTRMVDAP